MFDIVPPPSLLLFLAMVCNSLGHIVDRSGKTVRGHVVPSIIEAGLPVNETTKRLTSSELTQHMLSDLTCDDRLAPSPTAPEVSPATNIGIVVTNLALQPEVLTQLGRQINASVGRAIHPYHAMADGDQLWTVTTNEVQPLKEKGTDFGITTLAGVGSEVMWDAILRCWGEV